ncbi:MAG: biotin--[acetyl-CoA-carboxylase] ligase [Bacillota bacterium]
MKIQHIQYLDTVTSTNSYLKALDTKHKSNGLLVYTFHQTKGRGRRANIWNSQKDQDIALSIYHQTVNEPFIDLMRAAIGVVDTLRNLNIEATIKLPNDIYVDKQKMAGILIEKTMHVSTSSSIIGIGINVNSTRKSNDKAISIKDVLDIPVDKTKLINQFVYFYNNLEGQSLHDRFITYINFKNHVCHYEHTQYELIDITHDFVCVLKNNNTQINIPCQNINFKIKNR